MSEPLEIRRLITSSSAFDRELAEILRWDTGRDSEVDRQVADVITEVRLRGDSAVLEFTSRFDRLDCASMSELTLGRDDFASAFDSVGEVEQQALETAADRIRSYHEHQRDAGFSYTDLLGNRLGQKVTPLGRVGLYVPGGQASYPSTVLMTAIPAKVAGVEDVVMTVPTPDGVRNDLVFAAAHVAGIERGFCIGGAQAVAALALGTDCVPRVDKIVGPGGVFVAAAKRQVFGEVGIDMVAGPSEVLIVADGSTPAEWIVYDLFSQAEHDAAAQALLMCPDAGYLDEVLELMRRLLPDQHRSEIIAASLSRRGGLIQTRDVAEAVDLANRVAPEHLELAVAQPQSWLDRVRNAGAIFLGAHSPEVIGDYAAGPSHVLPTYGTARFSSPLGVYDFTKRSSVIELSARGVETLARTSATLAHGEGLEAHARAAEIRISSLDHNAGS